MATAHDEAAPLEGEICIDASQLRPGVHVRLPVPWLEHQFLFNSFVIADEEQARLIAAMKLPQLFCNPQRCKVQPLPPQDAAPLADDRAETEAQRLEALASARLEAQRKRGQEMDALRERIAKAEKHYRGAATTVSSAIRGFDTRPGQSVRELAEVCEESATALLADPDSAFVLIAEKGRDDGLAAHALSVMTLSLLLGKQARLPEKALHALGTAALLHDIGKRSMKPALLRNKERNRHEEALYQTHCRSGYDDALRAGAVPRPVLDAILHHHERLDGSGFPDRLSGKAIPAVARMLGIADRFDSLVNPVDSRRAISPSEALSTLWVREQKGFDSSLLQLFVRAMGVYPPGSIVQLSDGRIAAVVGSAPAARPLSPRVIIYAPELPPREAIIADLATQEVVTIERMLRLQDRRAEELEYLLPQRKVNWACPAQ